MRLSFVHQNFPPQFQQLAPAMASRPDVQVVALTMREKVPALHPRIGLVRCKVARGTSKQIHPWVSDFETKVIRGEATFRTAMKLRKSGFEPDVMVVHRGWGESRVSHLLEPVESAHGLSGSSRYLPSTHIISSL